MKKLFENKDFQNARIITYTCLGILYFIFLFFIKIECSGCAFCGMTRAIKSILLFRYKEAIEYNKYSIFFMIIIPVIIVDFIYIIVKRIKESKAQ